MTLTLHRTAFGLVLFAAGLSASAADPIPAISWRTDYHAARKEAQEKGRPLFVVIGSENCIYCKKQDATTFRDPQVIALLAKQYIVLKLDAGADAALVEALRVGIYPTSVIAAPEGKILAFLPGYQTADQLRDHLKKSLAVVEAPARAKELLATAKEEFQAGRYADCLDKCELISVKFADLPEGKDAVTLASQIKSDPERLTVAADQLNERTATLYLTLADTWIKKDRPDEARNVLEKVLKLAPKGRLLEAAKEKLAGLRRGGVEATPAVLDKMK